MAAGINSIPRHCAFALAAVGFAVFSVDVAAQCRTNNWTQQTSAIEARGDGTSPSGREYSGGCGLTANADGSDAIIRKNFGSDETAIATRFYLYPNDFSLSSGEAIIFQGQDGGTTQVELRLRPTGDDYELVTRYRDNGTMRSASETIRVLKTWQAVTVGWSSAAVSGSVSIDIDGNRMLFVNGFANNGQVIDRMRLGLLNGSSLSASGSLGFDEVEVRRTPEEIEPIGVNEIFNLSTRAEVGRGLDKVVGGFIIDGEAGEEKCVIVRARGRSLPLSGALVSDPLFRFFDLQGGGRLEEANNWQSHPQRRMIETLNQAPGDTRDAAMYRCLAPGAYTAEMTGASGSSLGVGIIEILDADAGKASLVNISTRANVRGGRNQAIAGFIIRGEEPKQILIRGRGPTIPLGDAVLPDPSLRLFQAQTQIGSNDDWGDAANAAAISATGRAPTNPREAAMLVTLQPGVYTAYLAPADGQRGIGIVEVLDLSGGTTIQD
ncbi:MAG: hypothetical protein AAGF46_02850 [Pseudomonadota bacterium]